MPEQSGEGSMSIYPLQRALLECFDRPSHYLCMREDGDIVIQELNLQDAQVVDGGAGAVWILTLTGKLVA